MIHAAGKVVVVAVMLAGSALWAQTDTKVESSRSVSSPDGTKTVVVDRFTPIVNGEPERFSGRMLVRVTSSDGSAPRQRYIEASQVRIIQPPVWVDDSRVCAFVYNVAKNSNGIVYFEPATNRAVQVEFVMPSRKMAASGKVEQELTSLEVTEFAGPQALKTRNIPWKGGSAFPLVMPPLPPFDGQPYGIEFLKQLDNSLAAYKTFLKSNDITSLEPEQASESFTADESWLGLLACGGSSSYLVGVPLAPGAPGKVLGEIRLLKLKDLALSCSQHAAGDAGDQSLTDSRFLTSWTDSANLQVIRESYGTETETPVISTVTTLNVKTGEADDNSTSATQQQTTSTRPASL